MNLIERAKAPTPKFFRILRTIGLALLAVSGSVIAAPVVLPAAVVSVAGYMAVAGGVISAVSQVTTKSDAILHSVQNDKSEEILREAQNDNEQEILHSVQNDKAVHDGS